MPSSAGIDGDLLALGTHSVTLPDKILGQPRLHPDEGEEHIPRDAVDHRARPAREPREHMLDIVPEAEVDECDRKNRESCLQARGNGARDRQQTTGENFSAVLPWKGRPSKFRPPYLSCPNVWNIVDIKTSKINLKKILKTLIYFNNIILLI